MVKRHVLRQLRWTRWILLVTNLVNSHNDQSEGYVIHYVLL